MVGMWGEEGVGVWFVACVKRRRRGGKRGPVLPELVEKDLILLGCTAVEDKLQV